jgi:flagellar operon protein
MPDFRITPPPNVGGPAPVGPSRPTGGAPAPSGEGFGRVLRREIERQAPLRFSAHALSRLAERDLRVGPADQTRIEGAVARAAGKGSRDALVLMDDVALIVSVKNRTVVTAMGREQLKENVVTNIDSTVLA